MAVRVASLLPLVSASVLLGLDDGLTLEASGPQCIPGTNVLFPPVGDLLEHPCARRKEFKLTGTKALIISTSHDRFGPDDCEDCEPTGVCLEEADIPYWIFRDADLEVDVASIKGGKIPTDGSLLSHWDCRLMNDVEAYAQFQNSLPIAKVNFTDYDIIYMAGGWGASWDLSTSQELGEGITQAFLAGKQLGSVCHGGLGFINAKKADGSLLVNGTRMTAVSDKQVEFLGKVKNWTEPYRPEGELRKRGAVYEKHSGLIEITASDVVVDDLTSDGRIITGQNQNSACGVAQAHLDRLEQDAQKPFALTFGDCHLAVDCYEGLYSSVVQLTKADPVIQLCRKQFTLTEGTCKSLGFGVQKETPFGKIVKDPIFRDTTIWFQGEDTSMMV